MNRRNFFSALVPVAGVLSAATNPEPEPSARAFEVQPFEDGDVITADRLNEIVSAINAQNGRPR